MYQQSSLAFLEGGSSAPVETQFDDWYLIFTAIYSPLLLLDDS